jgi:hypothetical protein
MVSFLHPKRPEGRIIKPEDQIWQEQFDKLTKDEHLEKLHLLGLDNEEAKELAEDFEEVKKGKKGKVLKEWEEEVGSPENETDKEKANEEKK